MDIFKELLEHHPQLASCADAIVHAADSLVEVYQNGGKLLVCGNGGSGADAEHIVGELMKEFYIRRPLGAEERRALEQIDPAGTVLAEHLQGALPAITLTSNIALTTAYGNDAVPELVFAQQVWGYGQKGDVLLAISTSGNSKNVYYAMVAAKAKGMRVIGLTGEAGGRMEKLCDVCIKAPARETYLVQEYHLPIYHALCRYVENTLFGDR